MRRPDLAPGGWAFEFANDGYPDVDDTAEVVLALRPAATHRGPAASRPRSSAASRGRSACSRRDGGWAAFDADNTRELVEQLPFCDFGAVIDPPSADVTAHVVEMLAARGRPRTDAAADAACAGCSDAQEPDGSWFGRWGANHVYGTGAAVPALVAAGVARIAPPIRRAVRWLQRHAERRRRLGRGPALLRRRIVARAGRVHRLADGMGVARPARRRR